VGSSENRTVEFAISTESLLKHGFHVIQLWTPHGEPSDGTTKDYGETNGTLTIVSDSIEWYCLTFKGSVKLPQGTDSFIVVLSVKQPASEGIPSVGITIPNDGDTSFPQPTINRNSSLDRTSRRMKSSRSVSVALRRRAGTSLGIRTRPLYLAHITIDPEGTLPWPDLS
jgi:hypothetical protein